MTAPLNPEEVSALMDAIEAGRLAAAESPSMQRGVVTPYDLTSRDVIIRGQMPTLDAINEQIASVLGTGLSGRIRVGLRATSSPSAMLRFSDVHALLAPPATVCVLDLGSGHGMALAVLEPGLADALLGAALGDRRPRAAGDTGTRRDLTSVERSVLKRLLGILTDAMAAAWKPVLPLRPEVLRFETDPRMAHIAPPTEMTIVSTFEFHDGLAGKIHVAIPFTAVESEKKALSSAPKVATGIDERFSQAMAEQLEDVRVELRAVLGRSTLRLSKLLELEVGDVLSLNTDENSSLDILVEGRPKLCGSPKVSGSNLAVVVERNVPLQAQARNEVYDRDTKQLPTRFSPTAA